MFNVNYGMCKIQLRIIIHINCLCFVLGSFTNYTLIYFNLHVSTVLYYIVWTFISHFICINIHITNVILVITDYLSVL